MGKKISNGKMDKEAIKHTIKTKYRGFCIIPWIKMLNYPSISTKLS